MTLQEKQDLKARFFGQHHGAHFTHPYFSRTAANWGCYLDGMETPTFWKVHDTFNKWHSLDLAKLILRPLSDITDVELLICAEICGFLGEHGRLYLKEILASGKIKEIDAYPNEAVALFDYLRSCNFALPFHGLDPVEAGFAILETTNQPQGATPTK